MLFKIIFLVENVFSKRDYDRFGIERFVNLGFDVLVVDCTCIIKTNYGNNEFNQRYLFDKLIVAQTTGDVIQILNGIYERCFVISLISYSLASIRIYRALLPANFEYALLFVNTIPKSPATGKSVLKRIKTLKFLQVVNKIFLRIPRRFFGIKPAAWVFAGGDKSFSKNHELVDVSTKVVYVHTLDYDIYLAKNELPTSKEKENYALFLDENLPFHPDFKRGGCKSPIKAEQYYPELKILFTKIENFFNVKIKIAAHPRAHYENNDYFGGRELVLGRTCEMVEGARLVLTHASTSINFAVLYKKPIIFLTSNDLMEKYFDNSNWAKMLDQPVLTMDKDYSKSFESMSLSVNAEKYDQYRSAYIKKKGTKEGYFWDVVIDELKLYGGFNEKYGPKI